MPLPAADETIAEQAEGADAEDGESGRFGDGAEEEGVSLSRWVGSESTDLPVIIDSSCIP